MNCGNLCRAKTVLRPYPSSLNRTTRTSDAFKMSQPLFVVGHVAIKQIVYLELVERELKCQKDERQATPNSTKDKDAEELDQVAGNAEDEIGEIGTVVWTGITTSGIWAHDRLCTMQQSSQVQEPNIWSCYPSFQQIPWRQLPIL
ncbi:hypothetical protein M378DRAFT_1006629 [Amanita muscaria Koide BX008]|uniref:Uncharacterized protein n=1 Tax=Amanita muscaria (strain Koide BX008) TaxID=946122 RepID=A0A0C2WT09_AMAMK|nr:hypothetical protein M378DRAFT_1006629 [Amanita muscaria Koide BX008]